MAYYGHSGYAGYIDSAEGLWYTMIKDFIIFILIL